MKLLKITYTGTVRHMRSVPLTGETEEVCRRVENKESIVLISNSTPFYVEAALLQFDHEQSFHDEDYERNGHEIIGDLYAVYRDPVRMLSNL